MFIFIIGVAVLISGIALKKSREAASRYGGLVSKTGLFIIVIGLLVSLFKVIEPGRVGVQVLFGKVQNQALESGLHLINPLVDISSFSIQTQTYTMSAVSNEGQKEGDDAIRVLSADGLEVTIDLSVLYKVKPDKAPYIMQNIGEDYIDKIVRPISRTAIRDNAVSFTAVDLYSSRRQEFQNRINETIKVAFEKRGLEMQQILVRNITLPASVRASIESKINAEQEAQKMQFVLQKEKQEAERKRVEAQGIADYQRILQTGLTDKQLQYEAIKAQKDIALSANAKVIIMNGKTTPVILNDK
jgi:regulator of protease activity HflC (stomatin/prohibitin superfamily)